MTTVNDAAENYDEKNDKDPAVAQKDAAPPYYEATAPDEDPGRPAPSDFGAEDAPDLELARTLINFGAVEPGTSRPPEGGAVESVGGIFLPEPTADAAARTIPLDINAARAYLDNCRTSTPRVTYGPRPGAKVPFHGATPGRDFTRVDCSGFVREAIWRATAPHLNFPDGSVIQRQWVVTNNFARSSADEALREDGIVRIAFYRPQDSPSGVGHVALVHNAKTLESHGGVGPNSRPWTKLPRWQAMSIVFILARP
jgi:hypothetical protein